MKRLLAIFIFTSAGLFAAAPPTHGSSPKEEPVEVKGVSKELAKEIKRDMTKEQKDALKKKAKEEYKGKNLEELKKAIKDLESSIAKTKADEERKAVGDTADYTQSEGLGLFKEVAESLVKEAEAKKKAEEDAKKAAEKKTEDLEKRLASKDKRFAEMLKELEKEKEKTKRAEEKAKRAREREMTEYKTGLLRSSPNSLKDYDARLLKSSAEIRDHLKEVNAAIEKDSKTPADGWSGWLGYKKKPDERLNRRKEFLEGQKADVEERRKIVREVMKARGVTPGAWDTKPNGTPTFPSGRERLWGLTPKGDLYRSKEHGGDTYARSGTRVSVSFPGGAKMVELYTKDGKFNAWSEGVAIDDQGNVYKLKGNGSYVGVSSRPAASIDPKPLTGSAPRLVAPVTVPPASTPSRSPTGSRGSGSAFVPGISPRGAAVPGPYPSNIGGAYSGWGAPPPGFGGGCTGPNCPPTASGWYFGR